jgi:cyclophilin family peptidyl-prolyl cis-trans isomerase
MENQENKGKFPWVALIVVIVIVGGFTYWILNSKDPAVPAQSFNAYSTSTDTAAVNNIAPVLTPEPAGTSTGTSTISNKNLMHTITLETNKGAIVFETYDADAPNTVNNFITLANKGFYNGVIFHRVIQNFMIQGGDPTGTGRGGPGYQFADELNPATESYKAGYGRGVVAMANAGPNTNGSQFFIMHKDTPLPNNYTIFGKVIQGIEVVDAIATTPVDGNDKPLSPITITKATVSEKN